MYAPVAKKEQSSTPSGLAYSRPPLNANTGMRSSDGLHNETRGQQNAVAAGQPLTPAAHGLPRGPSRGQQGVVERRPLRPPKEAQLGVPQSLPQKSRLSIPCDVFEDSFPTLNDYWQSSTPSGLAYSRPPLNANTGMRSSDGLHNETRGQQNAVAAGQPLTPAAHGLPRGPSRGQQGVVERRPLRPPKEAQLGVPQSPPPRPRLSTPYELFQDSFAILNDYWSVLPFFLS
ncbi:hypothetical protein HPB50_006745 [Hyalomma asiaticum]|uniref:Uncharacterized protein n=1 Tax=Hyalomma asiaticum TaxID=266040 RepID=A0ACB7TG50_HYAAI|nr:hypothetical protein HPB50_006745 [Hyalomma asiaticum]